MSRAQEDMNCIYRDPNQPVEARVRDLLSRMTLKEKAGQMTQIERRVATPDAIKDLSIARILKAKYFPYGDVFNASLGSNPSYTWRSIHNSLGVLKSGTRWRVGNGRRIHIWEDKWLPSPSTYKIITPPRITEDYPMVSSLIDPDTRWWKIDSIRALFLPVDAEAILKIPLSFNLPEDRIIWIGNKKGEFSVKSAYYVAVNLLESAEMVECSSGDPFLPLWKKLWKLDLPEKVKIFAWRACLNGLPTMINMHMRGLNANLYCPACDEEVECLNHCLVTCDFALSVWALWQDCPLSLLLETRDVKALALHFLANSPPRHLLIFFAISWAIWHNRNLRVHEEVCLSPLQTWEMAQRLIDDYHGAIKMDFPPIQPTIRGWSAPPPGVFKVNVDGACSIDPVGSSGVGVVIRDESGMVIAALCKLLPSHFPADWTELFAIEQGLLLAQEMDLPQIMLESDALSAILAINHGNFEGETGHLVEGILQSKALFSCCSFSFLKRDYNMVAHKLAQFAKSNLCSHVWKGSILSSGGSGPFDDNALTALSSDWADMVDGFQKSALESRLGIPLIYGIDAVHGNNSIYGATIFPHNVGLGSTRDSDLVRKIGEATALEVRASGIHYTFAPCVAVCRDPRWGRCYESYSEDTEIVRKMTSIVTGLQGQPPHEHPKGYPFVAGRNNVIACAKHFVGDGGTDRGINEGDTISSYEDLERIHMAPYLDCISQGVSTVMASYSSWNGRKLHADRFLLTEVLKDKLGFKGFVISDWEGLDRLSEPRGSNYRFCISTAINAGIDMVMVPLKFDFVEDLIFLVESGKIPMARIDDAVERILRVKFVAGLFEFPFTDRSLLDTVGCKLHRDLAREAVRKSLVLLKNGKDSKKPFLPLDRNAKRIFVTGTHADNLGYQCGGWTATWFGGSGRITIGTTILDAIKAAVGNETEVVYEEFPSAETLARQDFSFAIVAVGEEPYAETPGDNTELVIPFNGADLISSVANSIPTLVILVSGRPLVLEPWLLEKMDALIAAWLPGSEGGGITDVIFGDYDFKGRLPVTWFKQVEQLPLHIGINSYDPLFPLGFGLTSTKENSSD